MTTLDELKRAISDMPIDPDKSGADYGSPVLYHEALAEYEHDRAEAWRTAFEWREGWNEREDAALCQGVDSFTRHEIEGEEGMRLIREHLK